MVSCGAPLCCGARASYCGGFSCCGTWALEHLGFSSCGSWALKHGLSSCSKWALVAPCYVESSRTRDRTHVPLIGGRIPIHCITREVLSPFDLSQILLVGDNLLVPHSLPGPPVVKIAHTSGYHLVWPEQEVSVFPLTDLQGNGHEDSLKTVNIWKIFLQSQELWSWWWSRKQESDPTSQGEQRGCGGR